MIKYDCETLTEDELRAVFETLGLVEEENMNRLEHRIKNKINFDKHKFSGTKESLVLLNEVFNMIFEYQDEAKRKDIEELLYIFLSSANKQTKK